MTETLDRATLEKYPLPEGYELVRHFWYSQYGEIDETDIRWSVVRQDRQFIGPIYVYDQTTMTEALVRWLAQLAEPQKDMADSLTTWVMVMMRRLAK